MSEATMFEAGPKSFNSAFFVFLSSKSLKLAINQQLTPDVQHLELLKIA